MVARPACHARCRPGCESRLGHSPAFGDGGTPPQTVSRSKDMRHPDYPSRFPFWLVWIGVILLGIGFIVFIVYKAVQPSPCSTSSANAEWANVNAAVAELMDDYGIDNLPSVGPGDSGRLRDSADLATCDMMVFPYMNAGEYAMHEGPQRYPRSRADYLRDNTCGTYFVNDRGQVSVARCGCGTTPPLCQ